MTLKFYIEDLNYYYIIEDNNRRIIKLDLIDRIFVVFYISKYSYLKIYDAIHRARSYRKDVKTFEFNYKPSSELYGELDNKVYSDKYLLLYLNVNTEDYDDFNLIVKNINKFIFEEEDFKNKFKEIIKKYCSKSFIKKD